MTHYKYALDQILDCCRYTFSHYNYFYRVCSIFSLQSIRRCKWSLSFSVLFLKKMGDKLAVDNSVIKALQSKAHLRCKLASWRASFPSLSSFWIQLLCHLAKHIQFEEKSKSAIWIDRKFCAGGTVWRFTDSIKRDPQIISESHHTGIRWSIKEHQSNSLLLW